LRAWTDIFGPHFKKYLRFFHLLCKETEETRLA
jgi:hypothetical protein